MVLHRPVETAGVIGNYGFPNRAAGSKNRNRDFAGATGLLPDWPDSSSTVCSALVRVTGKAIQPPYAALESLVCLVSGAKVFILLVWQLF
jgi:hypothetical protein